MRSRLAIIIALIAIGLGVYGLILKPSDNKKEETVVLQKEEVYVQIWRAKIDLERGKPLLSEHVEREQALLNLALESGVRSDVELDFSPSTLLNRKITSGSLVMPEFQVAKGNPGYIDLLIADGKEPFPLQVSRENLVSGYIRPGVFVDILAISSPLDNLSEEEVDIEYTGVYAKHLLRNAKVLGVEQNEESDSLIRADTQASQEDAIIVILEIDPNDIARLSIAEKTMHLEVYRSYEYDEPVQADVRNVIENYSGVAELRGASRLSNQGDEL
ncbi:Flp pilus assembly protein CpaB [Vibrio splendidus]|uniref:Flp pilus assembly protein CpaB n=1 Tax=Vibrio splendidus TaxID=29497 RepID=UPI0021B417CC|nr:Flp pilus assembly protein CpaB [Vibrio splendidus]UWZ99135.1 Flp pilus assembly protein CpaB [Vibrio splendidus]